MDSSPFLPWYIAGPLIGLFVPLLFLIGNKAFGISSAFDQACTLLLPKSLKKGVFDAGKDGWKSFFVIGIAVGALISQYLLNGASQPFLPIQYFEPRGWATLFVGGLLIGFGTRYANGCTSGHAITGLSLLNGASLKATLAFFIAGLLFTWLTVRIF
ncbi:MAG: YeeE/YedE family protein [Calditrichaeota bacterium]|nr:MAG: YeeE/YedE family protein [Calditrichota bacterium]